MFYSLRRLFSREPGPRNKDQNPTPERRYPSSSPAAEAAARLDQARSPGPLPGATGDAAEGMNVLDRIHTALEEVRPAIRMDGGDIELVGFREGTATVKLKGACRSCPMAEITLQLGVERVLKSMVPEVQRVEAI